MANKITTQHDESNWKNNQRNQGYSGNQNNVLQGQGPDMENRHTQQRT